MAVVRWNPWNELFDLRSQMDQLFWACPALRDTFVRPSTQRVRAGICVGDHE